MGHRHAEGEGQKPLLLQTPHAHTCAGCLKTHCLLWDYMVVLGGLCLNWVMQNSEISVRADPQRVRVKSLYS